jgi:hypothetical protein
VNNLEDLARLGLFVTCLLAVYVCVRTLLVWRRTRKLAELAIGANVLGIAIGGALLVALGAFHPDMRSAPFVPYALGLLGLLVHVTAQYVGTWKIFRSGARWPIPFPRRAGPGTTTSASATRRHSRSVPLSAWPTR